jgi:hypothetical protein
VIQGNGLKKNAKVLPADNFRKQADTHALASSSLFPSQSESCNQWVLETNLMELRRLLQRK